MTSNLVISKFRNITQGEKPSSKSALFNCRIIGKVINNRKTHLISILCLNPANAPHIGVSINPTHFLNYHRIVILIIFSSRNHKRFPVECSDSLRYKFPARRREFFIEKSIDYRHSISNLTIHTSNLSQCQKSPR